MPSIIDSLPGIKMPIAEISRQLRDMWKDDPSSISSAPSEFRASQLNLIVHLGRESSAQEATEIFQNAIEFTQRHPGRIIVLAPTPSDNPGTIFEGKLFTQCYIGANQRQMCCCEALLLEYAPDKPQTLFNQVTIWLESDLPVYHWFHRIPVRSIKNKYLNFVKNAKRILYDSNIETDDFTEIPLPEDWRIRDLADARMLAVKQSIGQVLSSFPPEDISNGLSKVQIHSDKPNQAHAEQIGKWLKRCLKSASLNQTNPPEITSCQATDKFSIKVDFIYSNAQRFSWSLCKSGEETVSEANIGGRSNDHQTTLKSPDTSTTLAEALFFGN